MAASIANAKATAQMHLHAATLKRPSTFSVILCVPLITASMSYVSFLLQGSGLVLLCVVPSACVSGHEMRLWIHRDASMKIEKRFGKALMTLYT
jgi:hypothetical protein